MTEETQNDQPKDYYKILGIEKDASANEIKNAFRKIASENHPDRGGNEERFKEASEAYKTLSDEKKRSEYDTCDSAGHGISVVCKKNTVGVSRGPLRMDIPKTTNDDQSNTIQTEAAEVDAQNAKVTTTAKKQINSTRHRIILEQAFSWVTPLVFFGGVIIVMIVGFFVSVGAPDEWSLGLTPMFTGVILWSIFYAYCGFRIVQNREYLVIERFGEFNRIVHMGPRILCFPGLIDKIIAKGTLRNQEVELFKDETPPYKVDFDDGSTEVRCKAWFHIGPENTDDILIINEAIYKFTYSLKDEQGALERIEDVLESSFVPLLQALSIKNALTKKDEVADKAAGEQAVKEALEAVGIVLCAPKGFIITDIVLPLEIIALRQKKLEGESEADKQAEQGLGYARTIEAIAKKLGISVSEARAIYETQRGLETLQGVKANVTFVSPSIQGIQTMIGINSGNQPLIVPA